MRQMLWILALVMVSALVRAGDPADAVVGKWLTTDGKSVVEMYRDGDTYAGRIAWLKDPLDEEGKPKTDFRNPDPARRDDLIVGLNLIWGFTFKKNAWRGGRIYDPLNGKTYYCRMTLQGETLKVRGSLDKWGLAGRNVVWIRHVDKPGPE